MKDKYYLSEINKVLIIGTSSIFIITGIAMLAIANFAFKKGYEEAVKDFYNGKIKCDIVNEKIVWKK